MFHCSFFPIRYTLTESGRQLGSKLLQFHNTMTEFLRLSQVPSLPQTDRLVNPNMLRITNLANAKQGSTFPGAQRHLPLDFGWAPRFFRLGARNSMYINIEILFLTTKFIKRPFRAPNLKSKCQTLQKT